LGEADKAGLSGAAGKRILIIGGGPFQLDIINAARAARLTLLVADARADAPGMRLADVPLVIDTREVARLVAAAKEHAIDGVVTAASDVALAAVAAVVEALGLPGVTPAVMRRGRDKLETFRIMREAGLSMPATFVAPSAEAALERLADVGGFPCVIKPRSSAGGRGVSIVIAEDEIAPAIEQASLAAHDASGALIQAHARGRSVGVEAFFYRGEVLHAFVMNDEYEPGFVSPAGHSLPTALSPRDQAELRTQVAAWGRALGLRDGAANFDLRLLRGQAQLIEANLRLGGNSITELIRLGCGVDLSSAVLAGALSRSPLPYFEQGRQSVPVASRLLLKRQQGTIASQGDLASWHAHPDVIQLQVAGPGEQPVRVNDWSIVGRCIVRGSDARAAAELAEEISDDVIAQLKFERSHVSPR
jgi:biotin carboxylase